ncbi:hypothetical protein Solca_1155 [Solitalea canadensis DSM 3403]|uniref:Uncharacterized protein n=1 Tax=Solitalea canadensis (strain ATCC 29591 / DSM 3403 / JCM 21819 / LMG 8368 / NBRC 15130 / NCIMB 12057 / USAM 9D) TaxID=929556 RepID=H8KTC2_SOLCM|nr:hypothetical protein Solca_1155 [Solitalea canadensis DSM 3403]
MKTNELSNNAIVNIDTTYPSDSLRKLKTLIGTEILIQVLRTIAIGIFHL